MPFFPMPPDREAWLALRHNYVGASEISALFDCQADYQLSRYALWHVKANKVPPPDVSGPRLVWGLKLEEVIATAVAEEKGWVVRRGRYAACDDCQLGASLDFEIECDPSGERIGPGVLETKNVDWLVHKRKWTDGEPPAQILLQLQAQLRASGYQWGAVAALVGGNELSIYPYAARPALGSEIVRRVNEFWQSIADGNPPAVDGSDGAGHVLRNLYPDPLDDVVDLSKNNEWPEAVAEFIATGAAKKEAEKAYDEAKNRVVELLGNHKRGYGGGYTVNTAITPAKPDREAKAGDVIKGRAETRRYTAKSKERAA